MRTTEVMDVNGEFYPISFDMLRKGDKFRLFEPFGAIILNDEGGTVFTAYSDPEMDEHYGVWKIKTKETSVSEELIGEGSILKIRFLEETIEKLEKENELLKNRLHILNSWKDDITESGC